MEVVRNVSVEELNDVWEQIQFNSSCDPEEHCQCMASDG